MNTIQYSNLSESVAYSHVKPVQNNTLSNNVYKNKSALDKQTNNDIMYRYLHTLSTPLSVVFFSGKNIEFMQKQIRQIITNKLGFVWKTNQNEEDLIAMMMHTFQWFGTNLETNLRQQLIELNKASLKYMMPDILTNVKQNVGYLKDISTPLQPMHRPRLPLFL